MANPLEKGLHTLRNQVQERKQERKSRIQSNLKANKTISEEEWSDADGNLVAEERVVQDLEEASDYERILERLDEESRGIVQKLQILGGGHSAAVISRKRKRIKFHTFRGPLFTES